MTAAVAATLTITTGIAGIAAVAAARPATPGSAASGPAARNVPGETATVALSGASPARAARPLTPRHPSAAATGGSAPLVLTAFDRKDCPAAATACVDLTTHVTWLQSDGRVSFGPVRMEPGQPGTVHATPSGTFHVSWKAGPHYMSTIYHEQMPWATFFAPGGIAFHGGSLTHWSHGCVHLTVANAHFYQENLPIGAEVVVF